MKWNLKHVAFSIVVLVTTTLLCELALQIAALLLVKDDTIHFQPVPLQVEDPVLGIRGNPLHLGHDRHGFRNLSVPDRASIVALGDSQTYGVGVYPEQAWPAQFARMTGTPTYNMAFGSYGPTHSLLLLEEALALKPDLVIEAFYAGNDLFDSYVHVHKKGQLPELGSVRFDTLQRLAEAEKTGSIEEKARGLVRSALIWKRRSLPPSQTPAERLASRYELVRLGREIVRRMTRGQDRTRHDPRQFDDAYWQLVREESLDQAGHRIIFQYRSLRTVFTPRYRLLGIDLRDPRIEEGLKIALSAIDHMNARLKLAGIPLLVLLVPTKELVFKSVAPLDDAQSWKFYGSLIENEEEVWRRTKVSLRDLDIQYIDALPVLQTLIQDGAQPYPVSWDGHMNVIGHRAVADLVRFSIPKIAPSLAGSQ